MRAVGLAAGLLAVAAAFHAGAASADGPYGYVPPGAALSYDWTGIYIGGHAGALNSRTKWSYTGTLDAVEQSHTSFDGGGHFGLQKQWGGLVFGAEASYTWLDAEETSGSVVVPNVSLSSDVKNLLLVTGRLGFAWENALAYAKGGYATADVDFRTGVTSTGVVTTSSSEREHGWTAGVGLEYAVLPMIIIGVEYDYVRLNVSGRDQIATPAGIGGTFVSDAGVDMQTVLARLTFKLGPRAEEPVPIK